MAHSKDAETAIRIQMLEPDSIPTFHTHHLQRESTSRTFSKLSIFVTVINTILCFLGLVMTIFTSIVLSYIQDYTNNQQIALSFYILYPTDGQENAINSLPAHPAIAATVMLQASGIAIAFFAFCTAYPVYTWSRKVQKSGFIQKDIIGPFRLLYIVACLAIGVAAAACIWSWVEAYTVPALSITADDLLGFTYQPHDQTPESWTCSLPPLLNHDATTDSVAKTLRSHCAQIYTTRIVSLPATILEIVAFVALVFVRQQFNRVSLAQNPLPVPSHHTEKTQGENGSHDDDDIETQQVSRASVATSQTEFFHTTRSNFKSNHGDDVVDWASQARATMMMYNALATQGSMHTR